MYMRNYGDNDGMQSFRRGEYTIPANYKGNAFSADEPPVDCKDDLQIPDSTSDAAPEQAQADRIACQATAPNQSAEICTKSICESESSNPRESLTNIGNAFPAFDDLLLIGLILLLFRENRECDGKNSDIIPLLAILLLFGF